MSAPPFKLSFTAEAESVLRGLKENPRFKAKYKKIQKMLRFLQEVGPTYPGLCTHKMNAMSGPNGEAIWNSYVENKTPQAWRCLWIYDGEESDAIVIVTLGPHPD